MRLGSGQPRGYRFLRRRFFRTEAPTAIRLGRVGAEMCSLMTIFGEPFADLEAAMGSRAESGTGFAGLLQIFRRGWREVSDGRF